MKNIFIINPAAGPQDSTVAVQKALGGVSRGHNCEIYRTTRTGDATRFVNDYCKKNTEPVRFFSCGGDGTLNEVANGLVGFEHAALGCYPCGSGNDFVKYYGGSERFLNVENLLAGSEQVIDLIRVGDKYCVNVCDFGFDIAAAKTMSRVKYNKILGGKRAYYTGVIAALCTSMKTPCRIVADGETLADSDILLCTIANGRYVGGSFQCAPRSVNDDGYLDLCLVSPVSRLTFLKLVRSYQKGIHLDDDRFKSFMVYRRCKKVTIDGAPDFAYALDGEITETPTMQVEVAPRAIRFVVPY